MAQAQSGGRSGSAYELTAPSFDADLTSVGKGTPGGELLRRYWHPIAAASEVKDLPLAVRALGEDLILFRTSAGRFGLVYPRCAHRGANLFYGRVEEEGIRCCYHGWLFDPEGHCLDQACEPDRGGERRGTYRQPWYPVEERYGLVFAYMGPLDRKPPLPNYDALDGLSDAYRIVPSSVEVGVLGPNRMPCNWFQVWENAMDADHATWLHREQFPPIMANPPEEIRYGATKHGVYSTAVTTDGKGTRLAFTVEVMLPHVRVVPDVFLPREKRGSAIIWTLPVDDTHCRVFSAAAVHQDVPPQSKEIRIYDGRNWLELDAEGHQRLPGDYEAVVGQGPITLHSEEHLVSGDRGVSLTRRMFRQAISAVRDGRDPPNTFDAAMIETFASSVMTHYPTEGDREGTGRAAE